MMTVSKNWWDIGILCKGMHVERLLILNAACDLWSQSAKNMGEALHDALGCIDCFQQMVRAISNPNGGWKALHHPLFPHTLAQTHFRVDAIKSILPWQCFPPQLRAYMYRSKLGSDPTPFSQRRREKVEFGKQMKATNIGHDNVGFPMDSNHILYVAN